MHIQKFYQKCNEISFDSDSFRIAKRSMNDILIHFLVFWNVCNIDSKASFKET